MYIFFFHRTVCISKRIKRKYDSENSVQYFDNTVQASFQINPILDIRLNTLENEDRIFINIQLNRKYFHF